MTGAFLDAVGVPIDKLTGQGNSRRDGNKGRRQVNRRFGEAVRPDISYRPRPGAYGVILSGNRMLLTHQSHPEPEYQLPGGGIDPGEGAVQALHREVFEETGWGIQASRRLGAYLRYTYMPEYHFWARKTCQIYLCTATRQMGDIPEPHHTAVWLPIRHAVARLTNPGDRHFASLVLGQA
jgi:8-oxo-dGTP diphosphatase